MKAQQFVGLRGVVASTGFALLLTVVSPQVSPASNTEPVTFRVSSDSRGLSEYGRESGDPSLSADGGVVVFESRARLADGDLDEFALDIYTRDLETGVTTLVSDIASPPIFARDHLWPSISLDGRVAAFMSVTTSTRDDIHVADLMTGDLERLVLTPGDVSAGWPLAKPVLSGDGRYVAFHSGSRKLASVPPPPAAGPYYGGVYLYDRSDRSLALISLGPGGVYGNLGAYDAFPSDDGRYVAFTSQSTNLVVPDRNWDHDVFLRDIVTDTTELISVDSEERQIPGYAHGTGISGDGRFVAFTTRSAFVPGDANGEYDVYLRDRLLGTTERISVADDGISGDGGSSAVDTPTSSDGAFVVFVSDYAFAPDDTNGVSDVYVRDRSTDSIWRASLDSYGRQVGGGGGGTISADARAVAFVSGDAFMPGDLNSAADVFVRLLDPPSCPSGQNEDGTLSRDVHRTVEAAGPGSRTVHDINCDVLVPNGL